MSYNRETTTEILYRAARVCIVLGLLSVGLPFIIHTFWALLVGPSLLIFGVWLTIIGWSQRRKWKP